MTADRAILNEVFSAVAQQTQLTISVVVPAHQAVDTIGPCLDGLLCSGFPSSDILVVDDGSTDGTGSVVSGRGVRVLRHQRPLGPAKARNAGAAEDVSDLVLFVDADVVVHAETRARILAHFHENPDLAAIFGSYDDRPGCRSATGLYRNLLHHWVHQHAASDAGTFWTGMGAVRRQVFLTLGGFDMSWENIEDVEFGLRLKITGVSIRLDRAMLCTHLKDWTLRGMFRTDWKGRAVPWTRLIVQGRTETGSLNTAVHHQASAALVMLILLSIPLLPFTMVAWWSLLACNVAFVAINAPFILFIFKRCGAVIALQAIGLHAIHYVAALLGMTQVQLIERMHRQLSCISWKIG